jgi:hypothetical protein
MNQRKVVRYDSTNGDTKEVSGHGTRVAGVVAGRGNTFGEDEADGIACDAKLHIWDMQEGKGTY